MTDNMPAITNGLLPSQVEFQMFQTIARNAQLSGLYRGVGGEAQIFMILLAARELGISPMLALNGGIWNIQGKIEISARLMNGLIRRAGHSLTVVKSDNEICILKGKRSDGDTFECSFSFEDAERAGLTGRDVWKKYTSDMLYNRCMSRLARRLFSDVIGTAYVEGEISDAKEIEKLQKADFEEIKQNQAVEEEAKQPVISQEKAEELRLLFELTEGELKKNIDAWLRKEFDGCWEKVTDNFYNNLVHRMNLNIEGQKYSKEGLEA